MPSYTDMGCAPGPGPVYLDGFATTPLAPEARDAMIEAWALPANASSPHRLGERAAAIVQQARASIAGLVGCGEQEITFTSGATEANNLAILGAARTSASRQGGRRRIVVSAIEHPSVFEPAKAATSLGYELALAPVGADGRLDLSALEALLDEQCLLVSVMAVNNETGIVQPVAEAAAMAHQVGALLHCDATQALGKMPIDFVDLDVDMASLSAHKMYGPGGVGALYVAAGTVAPTPLLFGGGQQGELRPGTEPVGLIAGFGAAAEIARSRLLEDVHRISELEARFLRSLEHHQVRFRRVNPSDFAVPGALSLSLTGVDADDLVSRVSAEVAISTGSACARGQIRGSSVLAAMGINSEDASTIVRLLIGRYTSAAEIEIAASALACSIQREAIGAGRTIQRC